MDFKKDFYVRKQLCPQTQEGTGSPKAEHPQPLQAHHAGEALPERLRQCGRICRSGAGSRPPGGCMQCDYWRWSPGCPSHQISVQTTCGQNRVETSPSIATGQNKSKNNLLKECDCVAPLHEHFREVCSQYMWPHRQEEPSDGASRAYMCYSASTLTNHPRLQSPEGPGYNATMVLATKNQRSQRAKI